MAVTESLARAYGSGFDARIGPFLAEAAERVPVLMSRLQAAAVEPREIVDVEALDRIPILGKDALGELQAANPPFGGLLASDAKVRRIFQSPGPLYEPEPDKPDPWRWAAALTAAGFGADDIVLNASGYHLTPLGAMFEEAVRVLGATVIPAGIGNMDLQARACADLSATAYIGLPSYLKALLEKGDELSAELRLERAYVVAEPLPPSLRSWLEERVPVVRQGYGTAEAGNLGYECERASGLHVPDDALVQVCDLSTGRALWDGEEGQVVVTLFRVEYPLVRLGTGDLSAFLTEPCSCAVPTPRLAGWLGRVGEAVKVRGMFLHPRQAQSALAGLPGMESFRLLIDRIDHRDVLRCELVAASGADADGVVAAAKEQIRSALRFQADVTLVEALDADGPPIVDLRRWE